MTEFVPANVRIPEGISTPEFRLRMLTIHDLVKDFDAVATSVEHLKGVFGPNDPWPEGVTLEQDLIDLGWHHREFQLRRSFAYTVMSPDETRCLGCVYINPSEKQGYDASVVLWVRASERDTGLDETLYAAVRQWLRDNWWFQSVAFPGREINWEAWGRLPEKSPVKTA